MIDWLNRKPWRSWLCLCGGSVLTALPVVFPVLGWLEWISMIPLLAAVFLMADSENFTAKKSYWKGFLAVYCYYFVIYHWFVRLYPMDFVGLSPAASITVILAGWLGLSLLQALPGGLVFLAFRFLCRTETVKKRPILKPLLFGGLWVIFEWFSTLTWTGVPWGRLYMGQADYLPMMQISALVGSYGLSFLILTVNGLLAYALLYRRRELLCCGLSAGLLAGNLAFGFARCAVDRREEVTVKAAVIQGNIDSHEKWEESTTARMVRTYTELTEQAVAEGAELVVWPETTVTVALNQSRYMQVFVSSLAKEQGITLLVGALHEDESGEYNSLFMVTPDGEISEQRYDKRHLVPFGEYVPMRGLVEVLIPPLAEVSALDMELTAGKDPALFDTPWGKIGGMICFDSIYEMLGIHSVRDGAELMVISSNDSWFSDSAAVYQHQVQAQFRAIEEGRWIVRAANTGISTILSPHGKILRWLDPLTEGYAVCEVSFSQNRTPYSVIGNLFVYLCVACCVGIPIWEKLCAIKKRKAAEADTKPPQE